jgi:hypothetical protein
VPDACPLGSQSEELAGSKSFSSASKMREVLTALLSDVDRDSELGRRLRSTHISYRYVCPDLGLTLDVASSDDEEHCIRWSFSGSDWKPAVTLEMSSEVVGPAPTPQACRDDEWGAW